jgi:hypothetical protein
VQRSNDQLLNPAKFCHNIFQFGEPKARLAPYRGQDMSDTISVPSSVIDDTAAPVAASGDLTDELLNTSIWTDEMLERAGIPVVDTDFVSVGGGMGSFVMVNYLRIAGVTPDRIRVLTNIEVPWDTYEYLTRVSQIPRTERLRSDSQGRPDCLWGFPSYALRESRKERTLAPVWSVLTEPMFTDYWTPRAGTVFQALEQEMNRVRWNDMKVMGTVRMVRKRAAGGYFTILTPPPGTSASKRVAYRSKHVHLAIGYPGLKFLPDLQEYRTKYNDLARTVNAYEPHEHIYEAFMRKPSTVLVRGGGIVASRVLQRLMEDRMDKGAQTTIIHLFRTYVDGKHNKWMLSRRRGKHGFAFQGFNAPKSAWGGVHREQLEKLEGAERKALYELTGGAHTPWRKLWLKQMKQSREEGWYITKQGEVSDVRPGDNCVITTIRTKEGKVEEIKADVILDCTGLEADIAEHRIYADLLQHSGLGRNPLGRVDVAHSFEVRGLRSGDGRMYASGSATYGGYFAGVDTFLGLQFSAQRIADDLAAIGFCPRIGPIRSVKHWWKWMRHQTI